MIKTIIFDWGGVLVDLNLEGCFKSCRERLGFERVAEFVDPYHQKGVLGELEEGKVSLDEFYDWVLSMSRPGKTKADVIEAFKPWLIGMADYKAELLKELAAKYDLYILSNNNGMAWSFATEDFRRHGIEVGTFFKKTFLSYEMKLMKPGDEIFRQAIREVQTLSGTPENPIRPSEILFIDDSRLNVEAAARNGITAAQYTQGDDLRAFIENALALGEGK